MFSKTEDGQLVVICDVCMSGSTDEKTNRFCEGTFADDGTQKYPPCNPAKMLCPSCYCKECEYTDEDTEGGE